MTNYSLQAYAFLAIVYVRLWLCVYAPQCSYVLHMMCVAGRPASQKLLGLDCQTTCNSKVASKVKPTIIIIIKLPQKLLLTERALTDNNSVVKTTI